jgi:GT2 family glycosyltransferase
MPGDSLPATVVIVTKNRRDELRDSVRSAVEQTAAPDVLVLDDGSDDGSARMVEREFPTVRVVHFDRSEGYIVRRNQAARLAGTPIVVSIDDDATFSTPRTVAQVLAEFDDVRIGAVAMPYINVRCDDIVRTRAPGEVGRWVTHGFVGTAHAVRRDVFLGLGGFRELLFHQGEERDFCIRLLAAGFVTVLGRSDPVHHHVSPRRDLRRVHMYARRNDILCVWLTTPMPYLPVRLAGTVARGAAFGVRTSRVGWMAAGVMAGLVGCRRSWRARRPVSIAAYRLSRQLTKQRAMPLDVVSERMSRATAPRPCDEQAEGGVVRSWDGGSTAFRGGA